MREWRGQIEEWGRWVKRQACSPCDATRRIVRLGLLLSIVIAAIPAHADDFLQPLVASLDTMVKGFAALGVAFGFLAAGFGILGGSENSGKWAARALGASVFFIIAALGSAGALAKAKSLTGM